MKENRAEVLRDLAKTQYPQSNTYNLPNNRAKSKDDFDSVKDETKRGAEQKPVLPPGFILEDSGLYYEHKEMPIFVSSKINVIAQTRNENSEDWGRIVTFKDNDNKTHTLTIAASKLGGDYSDIFSTLLHYGLNITSNRTFRNKLIEYILNCSTNKRVSCASKVGWYNNKEYYILPDCTIPTTHEVCLQSQNNNFKGFKNSGTLAQWQEHVASLCDGNTRLMLCLAAAFAPPILPFLNQKSFGINLMGSSSIGKSSTLEVASSVWGYPKEYIEQWRATGNALEGVAEAHNDGLLCLDELSQVSDKEAGQISYQLGNGQGKSRMTSKGALRDKYTWNLIFLSTGEISVADKIIKSGESAKAGMLIRLIDIPADAKKGYGIFDRVHNYKNENEDDFRNNLLKSPSKLAGDFSDILRENSNKFYGVAIREYLKCLSNPEIKKGIADSIKVIQKQFSARYGSNIQSGQVGRVINNLAVCAGAGELAIKLQILPFKENSIIEAIGKCFLEYIDERGTTGMQEKEELIGQMKHIIESSFKSRFLNYEDDDSKEKVNKAIGVKRLIGNKYHFYIFAKNYKDEICKGYSSTWAADIFLEDNYIKPSKKGKPYSSERIPSLKGSKRIYHFLPKAFVDKDEEDKDE